ncbi:RNA polymerase sigma factor [Qipengyuania sp. RANM35]|uniref:RNA polymerase sigma factor n=1 Tax=Qipengyuania sp. RANM35 TaxID=3068635 RepID=UPI0034DAF056
MIGQGRHANDAARLFDELLVTLVQAGDRSAAERLAARWQPRLVRTARRLLADDELARVAVQECWLAILRGIDTLRDPARFAPWAFGILHRKCVDRIRVRQAVRSSSGEMTTEPGSGSQTDDGIAIRQAFALLPPDQRLAAQLFFVEGLTLAEIAEVQQVPLGTAKTRLFHARRRLKQVLAENPQGDVT